MATVAALAGRRVDAVDSDTPRFPAANVPLVQQRIKAALEGERVTALVCSAACGADLLALAAAGDLGIRRRGILPFELERFRNTSVTDRPGDWGPQFDRMVDDLRVTDDLVVLNEQGETEGYAAANNRILDEAQSLAAEQGADVVAVLVWEGTAREGNDLTDAFGRQARRRGFRVLEVLTR